MSEKLPPKTNDQIIEVSLKHVLLAFGGLTIGSLAVGFGIVFVRDNLKFRRQKAIIEAAQQFLLTIQEGVLCKDEKTGSSSPTKISRKLKTSSDTSD